MEKQITGKWEEKLEDKKMQEKAWELYKKWNNFHKYHGFIHPKTKISTIFLRNEPHWVE